MKIRKDKKISDRAIKPYIVNEDVDSTILEFYTSRNLELDKTTIIDPKKLKTLRKAGRFEILIKYTPN